MFLYTVACAETNGGFRMETLKAFLMEEAEFRLREFFKVKGLTYEQIKNVAEALYSGAESIFNWEEIDYIIYEELKRQGVEC